MRRPILSLFLLAASAVSMLADPALLPLRPGNTWTYRVRGGTQTLTVTVGSPALIGDREYFRLSGYVNQPLWVRYNDEGNLMYFDEDANQERLLTGFAPVLRGWYEAPFRPCSQDEHPEQTGQEYARPGGLHTRVTVLRYRSFDCADAGVTSEQYAPNIGLVERTETSIAGPRVFELVSARLGGLSVQTDPGASFAVLVGPKGADGNAAATLQLTVKSPHPVTLRFTSSQEYDAALRGPDGAVLWRWSADKSFLQALHEQVTNGRSWQLAVPLTDGAGVPLPAGVYSLEAWITSGEDGRQFSAMTPLVIE